MKPKDKLNLIQSRLQRNYESCEIEHYKLEFSHLLSMVEEYQQSVDNYWWVQRVEMWVQLVCISILASAYVFKSGIRKIDATYGVAINSAVRHYGTIVGVLSGDKSLVRRYDSKSMQMQQPSDKEQ